MGLYVGMLDGSDLYIVRVDGLDLYIDECVLGVDVMMMFDGVVFFRIVTQVEVVCLFFSAPKNITISR